MHKFYQNQVGEDHNENIWHILCRYIAAQKYSEALDILQSGALVQLKHGQVTFSL